MDTDKPYEKAYGIDSESEYISTDELSNTPSPISQDANDDNGHEMNFGEDRSTFNSKDDQDSNLELRGDDDELIFEKAMPNMGDDLKVTARGCNTWKVQSWTDLPEKAHGPFFTVSGFAFRVLLFPNGNGNGNDCVAAYLEARPESQVDAILKKEAENEEIGNLFENEEWSVCAQFVLTFWNENDPSRIIVHNAYHRFTQNDVDWGFTRLFEIRSAFQKLGSGPVKHPLIENNKINISAYVKVYYDETGVLWHNFLNYDSKKETGFVGLKNQGATCYLNSLLQSLFVTNAFRCAVYQIPAEKDDPSQSMPSALQRIFYQLQTSKFPVGTNELTKSFGWDSADAFTQHDVQELERVLMDNLECKMKNTPVEKSLAEMFVGQMKSYIKCINVDFESARIEDFWDIQLNVKGMKNLQESFKDYIQVETLNGENQYDATGFGLQDAEKGVIFQSFPPVLHLQLKRFEYDFERDTMVKINDRHEFPLEIDLSDYLAPEIDRSEPWVYDLHGVLVHSGDLNVGHYYTLLKPAKDGHWYKFDDDKVTRATIKEVLDANFGGDGAMQVNTQLPPRNQVQRYLKQHSNAYMLVYIRKSRVDKILAPVTEADVPSYIPDHLKRDEEAELARKKEREEQHLYMTAKFFTTEMFKKYHGFDLADFTEDQSNTISNTSRNSDTNSPMDVTTPEGEKSLEKDDEARPISIKVLKTLDIRTLKMKIAEKIGVNNPDLIRLWILVNRQNKTIRPDGFVPDDTTLNVDQVRERYSGKSMLRMWVECSSDVQTTLKIDNKQLTWPFTEDKLKDILLIFLKIFDYESQTCTGYGLTAVKRDDKISSLVPIISKLTGWDTANSTTNILFFEEIRPSMVEHLPTTSTFADSEIQTGDIIIFQKSPLTDETTSPALSKSIEKKHGTGFLMANLYFDYIVNRVKLTFRPRFQNDANYGIFDLWLSRNDTYEAMAVRVGERLGVDPIYLRFTSTQLNGTFKSVIRLAPTAFISHLFFNSFNATSSAVVLFEILDVPLSVAEISKRLRVFYLPEGITREEPVDIYVHRNGSIGSLAKEFLKKTNIQLGNDECLYISIVYNGRIHQIYTFKDDFKNSQTVSVLNDQVFIYAFIGKDKELDDKTERLIFVYHFQKDPNHFHNIPFLFTLRAGEKWSETIKRIQETTGIKDPKFWDRVKFAIVTTDNGSNTQPKPYYIEDDDLVLFDKLPDDALLGMDHYDKTVRTKYGYERAIFIRKD